MAKKTKNVTHSLQQKWFDDHMASLVEGRYQPFWRCQDVRSSGVKVKVPHFADAYRVVHLFSINELLMYMTLSWDKSVNEIWEQYGLPLDETSQIAMELGVKHPVYTDSKTPIVQTIDFICNYADGSLKAYAVKQSSYLNDSRTIEKLNIQERWCENNNIAFQVVTSDELKTVRCQNLEFLFYHRKLETLLKPVFNTWLSNFFGELSERVDDRAADILESSAELTGIPFQRAAHFFYYAIWKGVINFDWHQPLALENPASTLEITSNDT